MNNDYIVILALFLVEHLFFFRYQAETVSFPNNLSTTMTIFIPVILLNWKIGSGLMLNEKNSF